MQMPYRQAQIDKHKHIQKIMKKFPSNIATLLKKYNGIFLNLHDKLHLSDAYFADRSHLNDNGSSVVSVEIAKFIEKAEGK